MSKNIYTDLNIPSDSLYNLKSIKNTNLPQRIIKSLEVVKPDSILIINEKPIILFFHSNNEILNEKDGKQQVFRNCWNFAEAPIIIIENESDFEVYNGFEFIAESKSLNILSKQNLNYISILNGDYFKELKTKKEKRIDTVLLENIKNAREILIIELAKNELQNKINKLYKEKNKDKKSKIYKTFSEEELKEFKALQNIANSLIGRIIFIRYLIDRKVSLKKYKEPLSINDDLKKILQDKVKTYKLFEYLKDSFNGDWFPIIHDDKNKIYEKDIVNEKHLESLHKLISGFDYKNKTGSLFDIYDFSIIPIEFISNVYESFIGEDEQRKSGAYYTPTFLVDYILKYTVDDFFVKNPNIYNCKVLDPACGSGIFLVETLRKLVAQFEKIKKRPIQEDELKQLVKDNIFGIDKDENAISISVFSLYLAMLDYQNPKELDKFKFPNLLSSENNPNPNFFANDFFDTNAEYNQILQERKLDFIIGNPPYGRGTVNQSKYALEYIKNEKIQIGNQDIVQPFMIRVKDFVSQNTKIGFIVTSKVLYNLQTEEFRKKHFFNNFKINHILELSSVRKEIFENADVPVSIIFYEKSTKEEIANNVIKYISMKPNRHFEKLKILILTKNDFKKVLQSKLIEDDYLWKILVYGSYLDFNFIKRLKEYKSINETSAEYKYTKGMGIQATQGKYDISYHLNKDFIDIPRGKQSEQYMSNFYISNKLPQWTIAKVHRKGEEKLFDKFSVLATRGVNTQTLKAKSAVLYNSAVFKHTLTGVNVSNINIAKNFVGLLNSSLFAYYNLEVASSIGIEREQLHDEEKLEVPFIKDTKIVNLVSKIENLKKEYLDSDEIQNPYEYESKLNLLIENLDETVLKAFNLSEEEYALVDYANNLVIPWVIQKKYDIAFKRINSEDDILREYINIFVNHYSKIYEQNNMYFQANVFYDNNAIGIYFKVLNEKPNEIITWQKKDIQNFLKISGNHTLENLFIQKDIKGFESDGFYVVKPNEYKNWHKAIGYLDFYEFNDAILKAGKNNWMS